MNIKVEVPRGGLRGNVTGEQESCAVCFCLSSLFKLQQMKNGKWWCTVTHCGWWPNALCGVWGSSVGVDYSTALEVVVDRVDRQLSYHVRLALRRFNDKNSFVRFLLGRTENNRAIL